MLPSLLVGLRSSKQQQHPCPVHVCISRVCPNDEAVGYFAWKLHIHSRSMSLSERHSISHCSNCLSKNHKCCNWCFNIHACCLPGQVLAPSYGGPVWLLHEPVPYSPTEGLPMPSNLSTYLDISLADKQYVNRYLTVL